jgi:hypothetical protein
MHWIGYDKGSPHAHWIYWPETWSVTVERNVWFTADSTTVYTLPRPAHDLLPTSLAQSAPAPQAQPLALQTPPASLLEQTQPPPPLATSSGEEEVKVEGELDEDEPPLVRKQKGRKGRGNKGPPVQPMCQSTQLRKPSTTIQRIQAGEGTTREDFTDLADCNAGEPEQCEWANLVGYEKAIAATIQEAEGDPKTVQKAQAHDDWPS